VLVPALLFIPGLLLAQEPRVELVPYVGYNTSGSLSTAVGRIDLVEQPDLRGQLGFKVGTGGTRSSTIRTGPTTLKVTDASRSR
jgi:hypothetical protein